MKECPDCGMTESEWAARFFTCGYENCQMSEVCKHSPDMPSEVVRKATARFARRIKEVDVAEKRYTRLLRSFAELQSAAQRVVDEADRIHDSDPWPIKYRAPYAAITALRALLAKQYGLRG